MTGRIRDIRAPGAVVSRGVLAGLGVVIGMMAGTAGGDEGLAGALAGLVESGEIVGAQAAVGDGGRVIWSESFGWETPDRSEAVGGETVFLIASCSKPFASAVVMSLIEDPDIDIKGEDGIDRWMPEFGSMPLRDGRRR